MRPAHNLPRPDRQRAASDPSAQQRPAAARNRNAWINHGRGRQLEAVDQTVVEVHHEVSRAWPHMNY
eukprot:7013643-Prymnesium_polylepis.1